MARSEINGRQIAWAAFFAVVSIALGVAAWMTPAYWRSIHPTVVAYAGRNTPQLETVALESLQKSRFAMARLLAAAADSAGVADLNRITSALAASPAQPPEVNYMGSADPVLLQVFGDELKRQAAAHANASNGIVKAATALDLFLPLAHRDALRKHLDGARSPGVSTILRTRTMSTRQFIPAPRPGGQPLDAVILMCALLYEGERFAPTLANEVRILAEELPSLDYSEAMEDFYVDMLIVARRLDWATLSELLHLCKDTAALREFVKAIKLYPDYFQTLCASALLSARPGEVGQYCLLHGTNAIPPLRKALTTGRGSLQTLIARQQKPFPTRISQPLWPELALAKPREALALKILLFFFCGAFAGLAIHCVFPFSASPDPRTRAPIGVPVSLLGLLAAWLLSCACEPNLLDRPKAPDYKVRLHLPSISNLALVKSEISRKNTTSVMDLKTIVSIAFFAALQIAVYVICLRKIREIARRQESAATKLRLMENEENLFDGGLYVGIGGTATALVLQVLGVIDANLLAAYSSNLFGILCVALIKIRHVRSYKHQLIIEAGLEREELEGLQTQRAAR